MNEQQLFTNSKQIMNYIMEHSNLNFKKLDDNTYYSDAFDFTFFIHLHYKSYFAAAEVYKAEGNVIPKFPSNKRHLHIQDKNYGLTLETVRSMLIYAQEKIFSGVNVIYSDYYPDNPTGVYEFYEVTNFGGGDSERHKLLKRFSDDYKYLHKFNLKEVLYSIECETMYYYDNDGIIHITEHPLLAFLQRCRWL